MSASPERVDPRPLVLPPAFALVTPDGPACAFAFACGIAEERGAGSLVWAPSEEWVDLAVVLEPDEPLRTARRAFFVGMAATVEALGVAAPPEKRLTVEWPDAIRFDGARLGGGRLGWPDGCGEEETPAWLVFSATLIASKAGAGDPGLTPDSTSLEEEGFADGAPALVEAFARRLMLGFDTWRAEGFDEAAAPYLARLAGPGIGRSRAVGASGDLVLGEARPGAVAPLLAALREPAWLNPRTGRPRL